MMYYRLIIYTQKSIINYCFCGRLINMNELIEKLLEAECKNFNISRENDIIKIDSYNDHRSITLIEAILIYDFINYNISKEEKEKIRKINNKWKKELEELRLLKQIKN